MMPTPDEPDVGVIALPRRGRGRPPKTSTLRATPEGEEKLCAKCDEWWPADREFFHSHPCGVAGLSERCRACRNEYDALRKQKKKSINLEPAP